MITLPYPPSVNAMYRTFRGRMLLSKIGRQYQVDGIAAALGQRSMCFGCAPVDVAITAWLPDRRRRDADNLFKGALDVLVKAGVMDDDSQIVRLSIHKAGIDRANPRLEVALTHAPEVP